MIVDNGKRVKLKIDGLFDGVAGMQGQDIAFIPDCRPRRAAELGDFEATIDGEAVRVRVRKPDDYSPLTQPFLNARVLTN